MTIRSVNTKSEFQKKSPALITEGPINKLPTELAQRIIFLTDTADKFNTCLVSHQWNSDTMTIYKHSIKQDLTRLVRLFSENLDPKKHHRRIADLVEIKDAFTSLSDHITAPIECQRLFLISTGYILTVLKKLSTTRRNTLQQTLGHRLPNSVPDIFKFTTLSLESSVRTGDFDIFYILFHSCRPLSKEDRGNAAKTASKEGHVRMLRTLLYNGRISTEDRGRAVLEALENNHPACIELLLNDGSITPNHRGAIVRLAGYKNNEELIRRILHKKKIPTDFLGEAVVCAIIGQNPKLSRFLLTKGKISEKRLGYAVIQAVKNTDPELVQLLLTHGHLSKEDLGKAVLASIDNSDLALVEFLLTQGEITEEARGEGIRLSAFLNNPKLMQLLLENGPISIKSREQAIKIAYIQRNPDLLKLLNVPD